MIDEVHAFLRFHPFDLMFLVLVVMTVQAVSGAEWSRRGRARGGREVEIRHGHTRDIVRCPDFFVLRSSVNN
jgi:hypothetical protein